LDYLPAPAHVGNQQAGPSQSADHAQGSLTLVLTPGETATIAVDGSPLVEIQDDGGVLSISIGDSSKFNMPPSGASPAATGKVGPTFLPPVDVSTAQVGPGTGGYDGGHPSTVSVGPTAGVAGPSTGLPKDDALAAADTSSSAGRMTDPLITYETSPSASSVSAENSLSGSANTAPGVGLEGEADVSATRAIEGGFVVIDAGTPAATRSPADGDTTSSVEFGDADNGLLTDMATGGHKVSGKAASDRTSSGKLRILDAYAAMRPRVVSQPSMEAAQGGAIDLADAAPLDISSDSGDSNDGNAAHGATDIRSESGVALFCDMEVAVGSPTGDDAPTPEVPVRDANLPAATQGQRVEQNVKPTEESVHRVDPKQRVSMGMTDAAPILIGAVMIMLSNGVQLEPAEREPKRRFLGFKI
jgi:hypothetical protein